MPSSLAKRLAALLQTRAGLDSDWRIACSVTNQSGKILKIVERKIAPFFRSAALSAFEKTAFERNVEPVDVGTHSEEGLRKSTQRKSIFGGKTVEDCGVFPQIRSKESTRQRGPRPQARFRILAHPPRSECAHIGATAPGPSAPCCERSFGCDEKLTVVSLKRMPAQLQIVNQNVGKEAEGRRHHY
jgi:hypothetical protein